LAFIIKKANTMKIRTLLTSLLSVIYVYSNGQNENNYREEFILKIPVDGKKFYEQKVEKTPYFVREKILQIYPGENIFIEVEKTKNEITKMKVVKENLNPEKTISVKFSQEVKERKSEYMMLQIVNPFEKDLEYKALMFIVGHDQWIETNVLPIHSKLTGIEMWNDVIISIVLSDWKLL
jgi:hypothetical protein